MHVVWIKLTVFLNVRRNRGLVVLPHPDGALPLSIRAVLGVSVVVRRALRGRRRPIAAPAAADGGGGPVVVGGGVARGEVNHG